MAWHMPVVMSPQKIRPNSSNIWLLSLEEIVGVKRHWIGEYFLLLPLILHQWFRINLSFTIVEKSRQKLRSSQSSCRILLRATLSSPACYSASVRAKINSTPHSSFDRNWTKSTNWFPSNVTGLLDYKFLTSTKIISWAVLSSKLFDYCGIFPWMISGTRIFPIRVELFQGFTGCWRNFDRLRKALSFYTFHRGIEG